MKQLKRHPLYLKHRDLLVHQGWTTHGSEGWIRLPNMLHLAFGAD